MSIDMMKTNMLIKNLNNLNDYFCEPGEILKMIHSIEINIDIIVDPIVAAGALLIGILNMNIEIAVDSVAGAGALLMGILNMDIASLLNPLPELSEKEKDWRRQSEISRKLKLQILENEIRASKNYYQYPYNRDWKWACRLTQLEQDILVDIMKAIPSSHDRFTFPPRVLAKFFFYKGTEIFPKADWSMYNAAVEWEAGHR